MPLPTIVAVLALAHIVAWSGSCLYLRLCATVPPENRLTMVRWFVVLPVAAVIALVARSTVGPDLVDLVDSLSALLQKGPSG